MSKLNTEGNYQETLEKAWDDVLKQDINVVFKNSMAAKLPEPNVALVPFLDMDYIINFDDKTIYTINEQKVDDIIKLLLLHYLDKSKNIPLSGEWASFRQLEHGNEFFNVFKMLCIDPLIRCFGGDIDKFHFAVRKFDVTHVNFGDAAAIIPALPRVPIVCAVWQGDDEVPPTAAILFDSIADRHLYIEDLALVGEMAVRSMMQELGFFGGFFRELEEEDMEIIPK